MSLPPISKTVPDWAKLRAWNLARIEQWRTELEDVSVSADRAQQLRGMISALREQIAAIDDPIVPTATEDPNYG